MVAADFFTLDFFLAADFFAADLFAADFFPDQVPIELAGSPPTPKCPRYRLSNETDAFLAWPVTFFAEAAREFFTPSTALRAALRLSVIDEAECVGMVRGI